MTLLQLECLSSGKEFSDVKFRMDKAHLNNVNKSVLLPISGKVKTAADKVNLLIQVLFRGFIDIFWI
jgi:hypothetical protein